MYKPIYICKTYPRKGGVRQVELEALVIMFKMAMVLAMLLPKPQSASIRVCVVFVRTCVNI